METEEISHQETRRGFFYAGCAGFGSPLNKTSECHLSSFFSSRIVPCRNVATRPPNRLVLGDWTDLNMVP